MPGARVLSFLNAPSPTALWALTYPQFTEGDTKAREVR